MYKEYKQTKKGYLRHRTDGKRLRMEHCLVWEEHYGKIPEGMQIHHIDGDKTNNDISNLQLVTPLEHKRIHEGCYLEKGIWYKPCKCCGEYKAVNEENWYYNKKQGTSIQRIVDRAMSKRLSQIVECELQTVGNARIIQRKTSVLNLVIDGIPAFETKIGISHNTQKPVKLYEWLLNKYAKPGEI